MEEEVVIIDGPTYQYVEMLGANYYVKTELVKGRTLVDGYQNREMMYHRTSYASSISGDYESLYEIPFGLEAVSGDIY